MSRDQLYLCIGTDQGGLCPSASEKSVFPQREAESGTSKKEETNWIGSLLRGRLRGHGGHTESALVDLLAQKKKKKALDWVWVYEERPVPLSFVATRGSYLEAF